MATIKKRPATMHPQRPPKKKRARAVVGQVGRFSFDQGCPLNAGIHFIDGRQWQGAATLNPMCFLVSLASQSVKTTQQKAATKHIEAQHILQCLGGDQVLAP